MCGICEKDISMAESAHLKPVRLCYYRSVLVLLGRLVKTSLMPSPRTPPSEKWSGECSQIPWAYSSKVVRTNEVARSVIITYVALPLQQ